MGTKLNSINYRTPSGNADHQQFVKKLKTFQNSNNYLPQDFFELEDQQLHQLVEKNLEPKIGTDIIALRWIELLSLSIRLRRMLMSDNIIKRSLNLLMKKSVDSESQDLLLKFFGRCSVYITDSLDSLTNPFNNQNYIDSIFKCIVSRRRNIEKNAEVVAYAIASLVGTDVPKYFETRDDAAGVFLDASVQAVQHFEHPGCCDMVVAVSSRVFRFRCELTLNYDEPEPSWWGELARKLVKSKYFDICFNHMEENNDGSTLLSFNVINGFVGMSPELVVSSGLHNRIFQLIKKHNRHNYAIESIGNLWHMSNPLVEPHISDVMVKGLDELIGGDIVKAVVPYLQKQPLSGFGSEWRAVLNSCRVLKSVMYFPLRKNMDLASFLVHAAKNIPDVLFKMCLLLKTINSIKLISNELVDASKYIFASLSTCRAYITDVDAFTDYLINNQILECIIDMAHLSKSLNTEIAAVDAFCYLTEMDPLKIFVYLEHSEDRFKLYSDLKQSVSRYEDDEEFLKKSQQFNNRIKKMEDQFYHCASCSSIEAKSRCSRCRGVVYCNSECQHNHWAKHKIDCKNPVMMDQEARIKKFVETYRFDE
ncbi:hypothetical protein AKO1_013244 [Acrasis kona]|uniref:MYND-type domain-containing protein n=1 Tax=Acrasis kona TaxID=1008807 RepID=A0AAW2YY82_9EUKA